MNRPGLPAPAAPAPVAPVGFHAELEGASLWDLVQMECLARARRVVQVSGEGGVGYLYFSAGRVIHAVTSRLSGEPAALEILGWTNGRFQPCERGWPVAATIEIPHEALLLLAAKRRDEAAATKLLAFRGRAADEPRDEITSEASSDVAAEAWSEIEFRKTEEGAMTEMRKPTTNQPATPVSFAHNEPLPDFSMMLRVGANGVMIKNKGGTEELAGVVAYTHRLVELVGELLGLDRFLAMECTFKAGEGLTVPTPARTLLFTEANGDTVALRPRPESDIQPLRESLGL